MKKINCYVIRKDNTYYSRNDYSSGYSWYKTTEFATNLGNRFKYH